MVNSISPVNVNNQKMSINQGMAKSNNANNVSFGFKEKLVDPKALEQFAGFIKDDHQFTRAIVAPVLNALKSALQKAEELPMSQFCKENGILALNPKITVADKRLIGISTDATVKAASPFENGKQIYTQGSDSIVGFEMGGCNINGEGLLKRANDFAKQVQAKFDGAIERAVKNFDSEYLPVAKQVEFFEKLQHDGEKAIELFDPKTGKLIDLLDQMH